MLINDNTKKKLPIKDFSDYFVVTDFDRTITNGASKTSWSILAGSDLVPKDYVVDRQKLYDKYRPIEIDETMNFETRSKLVSEWYKKHIELFVKYKVSEDLFEKAASDLRIMEFREGARQFLTFLYKKGIPLIIISAGIGNFIECFLRKNNCFYDNIYISSNKILFDNGVAIGASDNIIHSLNKDEVSLPKEIRDRLSERKRVILLGDQESDLKMVNSSLHEDVITVGFFQASSKISFEEYRKLFDIVCSEEDNYKVLSKKLFN